MFIIINNIPLFHSKLKSINKIKLVTYKVSYNSLMCFCLHICVHILHAAFAETNIDKNIANYVKLQEKNLSFAQTLMHIYFTTGCSPLRNVFIIFCYGLLRPDKTQHSEVPTDLPSHTPQISHLFIRVCPVVHNYKAMCV